MQAKENLLDYDFAESKWQSFTAFGGTGIVSLANTSTGARYVIFWGDNTTEVQTLEIGAQNAEISHNYTDGKEKHIVRIFGG